MVHDVHFRKAVEASADIITITDADGVILYTNPAFTRVTGWSADEVLGKTPNVLKSGLTPETVYRDMWKTLLQGETWSGRILNRRKRAARGAIQRVAPTAAQIEGT